MFFLEEGHVHALILRSHKATYMLCGPHLPFLSELKLRIPSLATVDFSYWSSREGSSASPPNPGHCQGQGDALSRGRPPMLHTHFSSSLHSVSGTKISPTLDPGPSSMGVIGRVG